MFRWYKHGGGTGQTYAKALPRTVHGFYEQEQPHTCEIIRWYPYKLEMTVNGVRKPTVTQVLMEEYFPKMLSEDERIDYVHQKTGRTHEDLMMELFRMRRLRLALSQTLRDKLKGRWFRQVPGDWNRLEKLYLLHAYTAGQGFGMDFYNNNSFDPYLMYSPHFHIGDNVDAIFNKQYRTQLAYTLVEIVNHRTVPRARFPDVKGSCKEPIADVEPSLYELIRLKMSIMAVLAKQEQYVMDNPLDGNHMYRGVIVHFFRGSDPEEILHDYHPIELDLKLGLEWLMHYQKKFVSQTGLLDKGNLVQ